MRTRCPYCGVRADEPCITARGRLSVVQHLGKPVYRSPDEGVTHVVTGSPEVVADRVLEMFRLMNEDGWVE